MRFGSPITNRNSKTDGIYLAPEILRGENTNLKSVVFTLAVIWDELIHYEIYFKTIEEVVILSSKFVIYFRWIQGEGHQAQSHPQEHPVRNDVEGPCQETVVGLGEEKAFPSEIYSELGQSSCHFLSSFNPIEAGEMMMIPINNKCLIHYYKVMIMKDEQEPNW